MKDFRERLVQDAVNKMHQGRHDRLTLDEQLVLSKWRKERWDLPKPDYLGWEEVERRMKSGSTGNA